MIDAACLKRAQRDLFRGLARDLGVPFQIVSMEASLEVLTERISLRRAQASDASEADLSVLHHQLETQEQIGPDEKDVISATDSLEAGMHWP